MLKAFKEFALKGNVVDLAIGIIIGAQFNSVVQGLVNDIIMPPFGLILNRINFKDQFIALNGKSYDNLAAARAASAPIIAWGDFINTVISFLIITFVIFLIVRYMNSLRKDPPKQVDTRPCPYCLRVIPLKATRCPECTSELTPPITVPD